MGCSGPGTTTSHTHSTCISLSHPSPTCQIVSVSVLTGMVRDFLESLILKFPQEPAVAFTIMSIPIAPYPFTPFTPFTPFLFAPDLFALVYFALTLLTPTQST